MILKRLANNTIPELELNGLQLKMKAQVEQKLKDGIYSFEETDCVICGKNELVLLGEKDRYGFYYPVKVCTGCGLVLTSPRMTQHSYNLFYNEEYRKLYGGQQTATEDFFLDQYEKGRLIFEFLASNDCLPDKAKPVIEVGCGAGGILKFFKDKGYSIKGADLGEEYVAFGRDKFGLDLIAGTLKDIDSDKAPGVIIYSHVIEHLLDIESELALIRNISDNDTVIYIEVPGIKNIHNNYGSNILLYLQNAHTYHFSLSSLTNLMTSNGFSLINGNEYVKSIFRKRSEAASITNEYTSVVDYIQTTEKKYERIRKRQVVKQSIGRVLDFFKLKDTVKKLLKRK